MSDYSQFPFNDFSTDEIAKLMMDSVLLKDNDFFIACREHLKTRKDIFKKAPLDEQEDL